MAGSEGDFRTASLLKSRQLFLVLGSGYWLRPEAMTHAVLPAIGAWGTVRRPRMGAREVDRSTVRIPVADRSLPKGSRID